MRADDASYYRARALQEQVAAQRATSPAARDRHDEFAMMYRFKAAMLSGGPAWISDHGFTLSTDQDELDITDA
jgi:hypothetical protein